VSGVAVQNSAATAARAFSGGSPESANSKSNRWCISNQITGLNLLLKEIPIL